MTDKKVSDLSLLSSANVNPTLDSLIILDVSDTTFSAEGTNKRVLVQDLSFSLLSGLNITVDSIPADQITGGSLSENFVSGTRGLEDQVGVWLNNGNLVGSKIRTNNINPDFMTGDFSKLVTGDENSPPLSLGSIAVWDNDGNIVKADTDLSTLLTVDSSGVENQIWTYDSAGNFILRDFSALIGETSGYTASDITLTRDNFPSSLISGTLPLNVDIVTGTPANTGYLATWTADGNLSGVELQPSLFKAGDTTGNIDTLVTGNWSGVANQVGIWNANGDLLSDFLDSSQFKTSSFSGGNQAETFVSTTNLLIGSINQVATWDSNGNLFGSKVDENYLDNNLFIKTGFDPNLNQKIPIFEGAFTDNQIPVYDEDTLTFSGQTASQILSGSINLTIDSVDPSFLSTNFLEGSASYNSLKLATVFGGVTSSEVAIWDNQLNLSSAKLTTSFFNDNSLSGGANGQLILSSSSSLSPLNNDVAIFESSGNITSGKISPNNLATLTSGNSVSDPSAFLPVFIDGSTPNDISTNKVGIFDSNKALIPSFITLNSVDSTQRTGLPSSKFVSGFESNQGELAVWDVNGDLQGKKLIYPLHLDLVKEDQFVSDSGGGSIYSFYPPILGTVSALNASLATTSSQDIVLKINYSSSLSMFITIPAFSDRATSNPAVSFIANEKVTIEVSTGSEEAKGLKLDFIMENLLNV